MGRPKGSKNKPRVVTGHKTAGRPKNPVIGTIKDTKLWTIKDVTKYEARRFYWFMLALEKMIQVDPLSVPPEKYATAVTNFTSKYQQWQKQLREAGDSVEKRVDKYGVVRYKHEVDEAGNSTVRPIGMGARVPTSNPLAE